MNAKEAERKAREYINYISDQVGCFVSNADMESEILKENRWRITYKEPTCTIQVFIDNSSGRILDCKKISKKEVN